MWQGWIIFILGIWLFISGLIPVLQGGGNLIIVGIISAIFGLWIGSTGKRHPKTT